MWLYWFVENPADGDSRSYYLDKRYKPVLAFAYAVTTPITASLTVDFRDDGVSMMNDLLAITSKHNLGVIGRFKSDNHIRQESVISMKLVAGLGDARSVTVGLKLEEV